MTDPPPLSGTFEPHRPFHVGPTNTDPSIEWHEAQPFSVANVAPRRPAAESFSGTSRSPEQPAATTNATPPTASARMPVRNVGR